MPRPVVFAELYLLPCQRRCFTDAGACQQQKGDKVSSGAMAAVVIASGALFS